MKKISNTLQQGALTVKLGKVDPNCSLIFSCFHPCPSLPAVAKDDRKQFQCLNEVVKNNTGAFFLEFIWCQNKFGHFKKKIANSGHCPFKFMSNNFYSLPLWNSVSLRVFQVWRLQIISSRWVWIFCNHPFNSTPPLPTPPHPYSPPVHKVLQMFDY